MGLETSSNPLIGLPSYDAIAHLPLSERVTRMRNPEVRARIVAEMPAEDSNHFNIPTAGYATLFPLGNPPNYEPVREMCLEEIARREGKSLQAAYYDTMLEHDGRELVYRPFNYVRSYSLDPLRDLLMDPVNIVSLSDGGAHCAEIFSPMRARPPFCSRTGCVTVAAMEPFPWSGRSNARPVRPRYFTVWKTAARCFPV